MGRQKTEDRRRESLSLELIKACMGILKPTTSNEQLTTVPVGRIRGGINRCAVIDWVTKSPW